jgi:hypothetical protein
LAAKVQKPASPKSNRHTKTRWQLFRCPEKSAAELLIEWDHGKKPINWRRVKKIEPPNPTWIGNRPSCRKAATGLTYGITAMLNLQLRAKSAVYMARIRRTQRNTKFFDLLGIE